MEEAYSSKTMVTIYHWTQHNISEDVKLNVSIQYYTMFGIFRDFLNPHTEVSFVATDFYHTEYTVHIFILTNLLNFLE
jgi:hypothetical protein